MVKKAIIYTSATLNGSWFLVALDCAIWLNRLHSFTHIKIITGETAKIFNPLHVLLKIINLPVYFSQGKLLKFMTTRLSLSQDKTQTNQHTSEFSKFCNGELDFLKFKICGVYVEFCRIKMDKSDTSLFTTLRRLQLVVKNFCASFLRQSLLDGSYLNFKVDGVYSAHHVLSEALRSEYKSRGSILGAGAGILAALYKIEVTRDICKKIPMSLNDSIFVFGPDQDYIYGFFSRKLCQRGARLIETEGLQTPFQLKTPSEKFYCRPIVRHWPSQMNVTDTGSAITDYFEKRVNTPWKVYDYIDYLKFKTPLLLEEKIDNSSGLNIVIYLHSFTDAQFIFGHDGYRDLFHWSCNTINMLLKNPNISNIYLKPHPGIDPHYHPGDVKANNYLRGLYRQKTRVVWLENHFTTSQLKYFGNCVGITHHGSVAEELTFLGYPVIASTFSPWDKEYKFGYFWSDRLSYEKLISSLTKYGLPVLDIHRNELFRYVRDKNFSKIAPTFFNSHSAWLDFLLQHKVEKHHEFGVNMETIKTLLSDLDYKATPFTSYIAVRSARIEALVDNLKDMRGI